MPTTKDKMALEQERLRLLQWHGRFCLSVLIHGIGRDRSGRQWHFRDDGRSMYSNKETS